MITICSDLCPNDPDDETQHCLKEIADFWNSLSIETDAGETTWGVLEKLQSGVNGCLLQNPPNIVEAASLTAEAAALISGRIYF